MPRRRRMTRMTAITISVWIHPPDDHPTAVSDVRLERSGMHGDDMGASYQRHADLGDVAHELIGESPPTGEPLTLADVEAAFAEIALLRGTNAKRDRLRVLLARATAAEAR